MNRPGGDLLVVDDQEQVRTALSRILEAAGYTCRMADSVAAAKRLLDERDPELVLCDIDMPVESGLVLVQHLHATRPDVAVLMVTAFDDPDMADEAMDHGALGYIIKPFERNEILIHVAAVLRQRRHGIEARERVGTLERTIAERSQELQDSLRQLDRASAALDRSDEDALRRLACAAEFRDPETACHLERMSRYSAALGRAAGFTEERAEMLRLASPMHDVGKIGISDEVLLKEGIFTPDDRRTMEQHTQLGYDLLRGSSSPLLELAATVAFTHHERVDGSGYPRRLRGDEIPIEGRIVAIADVYDALTSARRYKPAYTPDVALEMMLEERGTHFDPELLDLFVAIRPEIEQIGANYAEHSTAVA